METVIVKRDELLELVRTNRDAHRAIYDEAVAGYKAEGIKRLNDYLKDVKGDKISFISFALAAPEDHTADYDRVIKMAEMSVVDELELSQREFAQYVMDEWGWKASFLMTNSAYSATAQAALR